MTEAAGPLWPLTILALQPTEHGVEALVAASPDALRTSALPGLSGRLLAAMPGLMSHECDNDAGAPFPEELRDTETAHALEHVALQLLRMAGFPGVRGETRWDFRVAQHGRFRVAVSGVEPPLAEDALRAATTLIAAAASGDAMPDARAEAARLGRADALRD